MRATILYSLLLCLITGTVGAQDCNQVLSESLRIVLDSNERFLEDSLVNECEFTKLETSYLAYLKKEPASIVANHKLGVLYRDQATHLAEVYMVMASSDSGYKKMKHQIEVYADQAKMYIDRARLLVNEELTPQSETHRSSPQAD
jgi:hypothetical protein